jgi:hypothetical protein
MSNDKYIGTNVGAMGPHSQATNVVFDQRRGATVSDVDLKAVVAEIARLRPELRKRAVEPEHDDAVAAAGRAEAAASKGDATGALTYLRAAGSWVGTVAAELGCSVVAKLIEGQIGISP